MLPYPGDHHRGSPPPYPAAPAPPSSLSPSAVPFTVDCPRPAADPTVPNPGFDLPTAPSLYATGAGDWRSASWMEPPASYMTPAAAAAAPAPAPPPAYKGEAPETSPYGIFPGTFQFGSFMVKRPLRSESSQLTSAKGPGTWLGSSEVLPSGVGPSVFSRQQNTFVHKSEDAEPYPTQRGLLQHKSEDAEPYPTQQGLLQHKSENAESYLTQRGLLQYPPQYPAYDKYMTQLSSCSTDAPPPVMWTPPAKSSEVVEQMFPVMNKNTGESSSSFSSYMNPCRINLDYFDCMWNEQKDLGHQTTDKHYGKWSSSASNMATGGDHLLNSLGADHHAARCFGNGRPMQEFSKMKYDWGSFNSKVSPSEVGYGQSHEFSSECPEVNNPTVDSPCWKGAPVAYPPSFGIMKNTDNPHSVNGAGGYNSSHQIEQSSEWSLKYSEIFSKQQEVSASESVKSDALKTFKLPVTRKNTEDRKEAPPVCIGVHNSIGNNASYSPEEQISRRQKCYESAEDWKNMIAVNQQENLLVSKAKLLGEDSANHIGSITGESIDKGPSPLGSAPRPPVENLSENLHVNVSSQVAEAEECTQPQTRARGIQEQPRYYSDAGGSMLKTSYESRLKSRAELLKQMHDLSAMLLSICNGGPLQGYEEDLLQLVIQNLRDASSSRSKVQNTSCSRNNLWMAMPEHSLVENNSELKTSISQAVAKLPVDKTLDDIDVSQLSIYKNLWIEAEASACKLKYELQLTRVKLAAMENHNNTQVPVDSSKGNKVFISTISNSKPQNYDKESSAYPVNLQCQGGDSCDGQSPAVNRSIADGVDAEVIERLKFLQSNFEDCRSFCENNYKEQEEASKKPCAIEDAVMARLRVLNSRPDNITSLKQENNNHHQLDTSTNRADNIDDVVMSRLRILKSRPDNESSKHEPDATTGTNDLVGNTVMSRLRILKCRNDNINSVDDVIKQHVEACTDQPNWDEDGVVAKIQAPSGDTAIVADGYQNILHSNNFVRHSEGKDSVSGLDSLGDATCSDEDNGCKAPSDEVNDKSAVQSEGSFAMNHGWPQSTMDSHISTTGSQETPLISSSVHKYDIFPPEWEHMLKENFFHPGK
uniref:Uncharacterized protein n=1 Tax=Oryza punctata TaxID=4537 RepID=A0A0E0MA62_ORYPU